MGQKVEEKPAPAEVVETKAAEPEPAKAPVKPEKAAAKPAKKKK
jgi:hypothetical protein